ncbi:hypothetical protein [Jiangella asiatica]|nr:hypothetical protein [Jiangella asiatica]
MGTRPCATQVREGRLAKAEGFIQAADDISLLDDGGQLGDAVGLLVFRG